MAGVDQDLPALDSLSSLGLPLVMPSPTASRSVTPSASIVTNARLQPQRVTISPLLAANA
jgi:hypothetical protein